MEVSYQRYRGITVFRDYDEKGREWPTGFSVLLFEKQKMGSVLQDTYSSPTKDKTLPKVDCGQRVAVAIVHQNEECTPHR